MNNTLNKFLKCALPSVLLRDFETNTNVVNSIIQEIKKVEDYAKTVSYKNKNEITILENKLNPVLILYSNNEKLLINNQTLLVRIELLKHRVEELKSLCEFENYIIKFESLIANFRKIEELKEPFEIVETFFKKYESLITTEEELYNRYLSIFTFYNDLISNKESINKIFNDLSTVITERNYISLGEALRKDIEELSKIFDEVLSPKVESALELLDQVSIELEKEKELAKKIQTVDKLIESSQWQKTKFVEEVSSYVSEFKTIIAKSLFKDKSIFDIEIYKQNAANINKLEDKIKKIVEANKEAQAIQSDINNLKNSNNISKIDIKVKEIKKRFQKFAYKSHYDSLKNKIEKLLEDRDAFIKGIAEHQLNNYYEKAKNTNDHNHLGVIVNDIRSNIGVLNSSILDEINYRQILDFVVKKYKKEKRAYEFSLSHSPVEFFYILVIAVFAGLGFGYLVLYKNGYAPSAMKWLFENPPFFGHKWSHWGLEPWKWVTGAAESGIWYLYLLMPIIFVVAVISMLVCLIVEAVWLLLTLIAFGVSWLFLTILSLIILALDYIVIAALAFLAGAAIIAISQDNSCKMTFAIMAIVLTAALGVAIYLVRFDVIKIWR